METDLQWPDALLGGVVAALGIVSTVTRDRRLSIVSFVVLGLVLTLIWARLLAPDVALAEAAIGAGVGGALLMSTLVSRTGLADAMSFARPVRWLGGIVAAVFGASVAWVLSTTLAVGNGWRLGTQVYARLDESGVGNPVTAVLLNFRGYDTLLELAVLLVAVLGIRALGSAQPRYVAEPAVVHLAIWLVPVLIVIAGYVLWAGANFPGGAFQAGALLGGAGVLLVLSGRPWGGLPSQPELLHVSLVQGTATFLLVGVGLAIWGDGFLDYPDGQAGLWILLIEVAATLSIGATLVLAFTGGTPARTGEPLR